MKIAIMQPTFLPWIGYFGMIQSVDTFVFLDNVQFNKRSWQQRNRIKTPAGEAYLSVSVLSKGKSDQEIKDVLIDPNHFSTDKMLSTISQNYRKSAFFKEYFPQFESVFKKERTHLNDLNIELIEFFSQQLGLKNNFIRSSKMSTNGAKADLLADICVQLGAKNYLSAPGSKMYIDESSAFKDRGIQVFYHEFNHPTYTQIGGDFIPYLSIIDLLFNEGPKSKEIILSGYKK